MIMHLFSNLEGPWGYWFIALFQQLASIGNNIAIQIAAGSSLKVPPVHLQKMLSCQNTIQKCANK